MNIDQFMTALESTYGRYENEFIYALVVSFVRDNFKEEEYEELFKQIVVRYGTDFKKPLDVAKLAKILEEKAEIVAEKIWQEMLRKSSAYDTIITDPYAYQVVAGYGSWSAFCEQRDKNREWTHKDFLKRYMMFLKAGEKAVPRLLVGLYTEAYGTSFKASQITIIGEEEEGRKLLENKASQGLLPEHLSPLKNINKD